MKRLTTPVISLILTVVMYNCNSSSNRLTEGKSVDTVFQADQDDKSSFAGHSISFYLAHDEIPQVCKDLYTKRRPTSDDSDVLALMDSIFTSSDETRPFYFLTLTSTMEKADGAYSEPLGVMSKQFVETRTKDFITYFDNETMLTDNDFDEWAKTVAGEIQISFEDHEKLEVDRVKAKMIANCSDCDEGRIQKIGEFVNRLQYHSP